MAVYSSMYMAYCKCMLFIITLTIDKTLLTACLTLANKHTHTQIYDIYFAKNLANLCISSTDDNKQTQVKQHMIIS